MSLTAYAIDTSSTSKKEFFEDYFPDSEVIDDYILKLSDGRTYDIYQMIVEGIDLGSIVFYQIEGGD